MTDEFPKTPTRAEIAKVANAIIEDRVYSILDVPSNLLAMVFLPITLGALKDWSHERLAQYTVFGVLGWDDTLDQSVNGYPMFASCRVWKHELFAEAVTLATRLAHAQQEVLGHFAENATPERDGPIDPTGPAV